MGSFAHPRICQVKCVRTSNVALALVPSAIAEISTGKATSDLILQQGMPGEE
jgi:hypothetical protein